MILGVYKKQEIRLICLIVAKLHRTTQRVPKQYEDYET